MPHTTPIYAPIDGMALHHENTIVRLELKPITVLVGDSSKSLIVDALVNTEKASSNFNHRMKETTGSCRVELQCQGGWTQVDIRSCAENLWEGSVSLPEPLRETVVWSSFACSDFADVSLICGWMGRNGELWMSFCDDVRSVGLCDRLDVVRDWKWDDGQKRDCLFLISKAGKWTPVYDLNKDSQRLLDILSKLTNAYAGTTVCIVCPEMGLHPKTLIALVDILVRTARQGVNLIVETNSSVVIRALTANVAEDDSGWVRDNLALHWFARDDQGGIVVTTADVRLDGSFGDWPCDLTTTELDLARRVLVAGHKRRASLERQGPT